MSAHDRYLQRALVLAKQNKTLLTVGAPSAPCWCGMMRLSLKASIPFI